MRKALFAGTFDPPTLGHLDIIARASKLCDQLYIGIALNPQKPTALFSNEQRAQMLRTLTTAFANVEVVTFSSLTTQFAKEKNIDVLIRGLRAHSDLESELQIAFSNRALTGIETLFLMADGKFAHISSTLIREIGRYGTRLHAFVPPEIESLVFNTLHS